jgi:hypothetical protein
VLKDAVIVERIRARYKRAYDSIFNGNHRFSYNKFVLDCYERVRFTNFKRFTKLEYRPDIPRNGDVVAIHLADNPHRDSNREHNRCGLGGAQGATSVRVM